MRILVSRAAGVEAAALEFRRPHIGEENIDHVFSLDAENTDAVTGRVLTELRVEEGLAGVDEDDFEAP